MHDANKREIRMEKSMKENLYTLILNDNEIEYAHAYAHNIQIFLAEMCTVTYCGVCVVVLFSHVKFALFFAFSHFPFQFLSLFCFRFFLSARESLAWKVKWHTHIDIETRSHFIDIDVVVVHCRSQLSNEVALLIPFLPFFPHIMAISGEIKVYFLHNFN